MPVEAHEPVDVVMPVSPHELDVGVVLVLELELVVVVGVGVVVVGPVVVLVWSHELG